MSRFRTKSSFIENFTNPIGARTPTSIHTGVVRSHLALQNMLTELYGRNTYIYCRFEMFVVAFLRLFH